LRARSVKRGASAVGEGSVVIQYVHEYLAAFGPAADQAPTAGKQARMTRQSRDRVPFGGIGR
jgi:hypothetical protein